jgi:hypothetical protein
MLDTDRVSALLRVEEIASPHEPVDDGGLRQLPLDLGVNLVGIR